MSTAVGQQGSEVEVAVVISPQDRQIAMLQDRIDKSEQSIDQHKARLRQLESSVRSSADEDRSQQLERREEMLLQELKVLLEYKKLLRSCWRTRDGAGWKPRSNTVQQQPHKQRLWKPQQVDLQV